MFFSNQNGNSFIDNSKFKVAMYIRLSREDGDKLESESVSNQRIILERYIKENNLLLIDEYVDDGVSGTTFNRPQFNRLLNDIENEKINMVITKDLSRLGRDYIKTGYYLENFFPEKNIRYVSLLDGIDTFKDSTNNDVTPFKAIINDMYARDISKKIKGVYREKELKGEYLAPIAPFGYKKSDSEKNKLIIDENVSYIVKKIFDLYSSGYGFLRIATYLDKEGIIPPSKYLNLKYQRNTWNPKSIRAILVNEAYIGNTVQNKRVSISYKVKKRKPKNENEYIRVENTHEPIITKEQFYKVQDIIKGRKTMSATKHDFLFKGLMFCHNCGRQSRVCYRGRNKKIGYIDCSLARGKDRKCKTCNYNYEKFETRTLNIIRNICQIYCDKKMLNNIYDQYNNSFTELINEKKQNLTNCQHQIEEITRRIDKIYFDYLNQLITEYDYSRYSKTQIEERNILLKRKEEILNEIDLLKSRKNKEEKKANSEEVINEFLSLEKPSKKIIYELVDRIELDEHKNIYLYFNFSELNLINNSILQ